MPVINMPQDPSGMVPDWLNPYANPQSGQESGWPIDASSVGTMGAGIVNPGDSQILKHIIDLKDMSPELASLLKYLQSLPSKVNILFDKSMSRLNYGGTSVKMGGQPTLSPALIASSGASPVGSSELETLAQRVINGGGQLFDPLSKEAEQIVRLNPYMARENQNILNVISHELDHTYGNTLNPEQALIRAQQGMSLMDTLPINDLTNIQDYAKKFWPNEVNARLFANRNFNPYLK